MTPPLISVLEEGQSSSSFAVSSTSLEEICLKSSELKERNYMGLSDCSSVDSSALPGGNSEGTKCSLNLRLGLPGSQSPERNPEACLMSPRKLDEKWLFPFLPTKQDTPSKDDSVSPLPKNIVLRNKRGFSDVMAEFSEVKDVPYAEGNWMFPANGNESETSRSMAQGNFIKSEVNLMLSRPSLNSGLKSVSVKDDSGADPGMLKGVLPAKGVQDKFHGTNGKSKNKTGPTANTSIQPSAKAQVIGWPPIRSFRKNTLVANTKNNEEVEKPGPGALYVKVSMDGAPYLRKVDLRSYSCYRDLSSALEKMFSCFTIGQCGPHGAPGREILSESKMRDLLHGSEYVLTCEDKDQDWMLVGDVPWEMFINSCKRMRIMKSCDAIGLAPRAMEKCKNRN